jgi:hypothetical protein
VVRGDEAKGRTASQSFELINKRGRDSLWLCGMKTIQSRSSIARSSVKNLAAHSGGATCRQPQPLTAAQLIGRSPAPHNGLRLRTQDGRVACPLTCGVWARRAPDGHGLRIGSVACTHGLAVAEREQFYARKAAGSLAHMVREYARTRVVKSKFRFR